MVGPAHVVQPWMPRVARDSAAWLCHVSIVGGARRRGCAAAGVSVFLDGPLKGVKPLGEDGMFEGRCSLAWCETPDGTDHLTGCPRSPTTSRGRGASPGA